MTPRTTPDGTDIVRDTITRLGACEQAILAIAPWIEPHHLDDAMDALRARFRAAETHAERLVLAAAIDLLGRSQADLNALTDLPERWR